MQNVGFAWFACNLTTRGSFTILAGINEEFLIISVSTKYFCIVTIDIEAKTNIFTAIIRASIKAGKFNFFIIILGNVKAET